MLTEAQGQIVQNRTNLLKITKSIEAVRNIVKKLGCWLDGY